MSHFTDEETDQVSCPARYGRNGAKLGNLTLRLDFLVTWPGARFRNLGLLV